MSQKHPSNSEGRNEQRLQKILAAAGIASRRKAEDLIREGRVQVNGQAVTELGSKADADKDHIRVDGKLLKKTQNRTFMLNKPKGVVTTVSDPEGRPTVMQFFSSGPRLFPVGRLDYQSEGLLLMTNDGELANALTKASSRVEKTYLVKVSGKPREDAVEQLRHGVMIEKGRRGVREGRILTQPARVTLVRDAANPWYEVVLVEGRNREIRKMFEEVGHFVEKIRRVGFGPLILDLPPGELRELSADEIARLSRAARRGSSPPESKRETSSRPRSGPAALPRRTRKPATRQTRKSPTA